VIPPRTRRLRLLLADDDDRVRRALAGLLAEEDDLCVVAEAADGATAVALAAEHGPDLVVVDVRMPQGGPQLVRALRVLPHRPLVVALSAQADAAAWTGMVAAGACGYLLKGAVAADLPALLRRCAARELVVTVPGAADVVRRLLDGGS
jgi:two-component system invasion response regulator UvrY